MPPYGLHEGFREFNGCYYSDCYYTKNANFFNDVQLKRHTLGFDAVIFPVPSFRHDHVSGIETYEKLDQVIAVLINDCQ